MDRNGRALRAKCGEPSVLRSRVESLSAAAGATAALSDDRAGRLPAARRERKTTESSGLIPERTSTSEPLSAPSSTWVRWARPSRTR